MTLIMGHWEAWGGSQTDPRLEKKSDPSSFRTCESVRLVSRPVDLILEILGLMNE